MSVQMQTPYFPAHARKLAKFGVKSVFYFQIFAVIFVNMRYMLSAALCNRLDCRFISTQKSWIVPAFSSFSKDCFSIPGDCIDPDALSKGWQTSGSMALTRLAFNLWNGFDDNYCTPTDLFNHAYAPYLFQAVQLRYPEHFRGKDAPIFDER